ncbi:Glycosyltransferase [Granulicella sibirica]|uniref:Glycosyltransferase n=2 Tax=Granulicella sibirica TaxID=2479048 RepID=A0A4Q0T396_9BACT|nr:Glycosyltransferase [Granulicella sibirica]
MRILHVIGTLNPAAGGPTESVRMLLGYRDLGYEGEVVTLDDPGAPFLQDLPFRVHALGPQTSVYGFNRKLLPWLRENRDRFDGVVVNGLWQYTGLATLWTIKGHRPYMVFTHGMLDPYFKHRYPLKHIKKWLYWVPAEYWILRGAYRVLFTCKAESELAKQSFWLHSWKPYVVPYGAQGSTGDRDQMVESFFEVCPGVRHKRYLLFLGRIDRKKGCDLLIEAFAATALLDPGLHLVMAGPDARNWRPKLVERAVKSGCADRIHWPGIVLGDVKWGAFYGSEAFILPSHQENFGIAVAEALSCGKPTLLSDKVNIAPEISLEGAGYMEPDTVAGTEALLRRWIQTTSEERREMSDNALAIFRSRYDMRENAKAIMRLFELAAIHAGELPALATDMR